MATITFLIVAIWWNPYAITQDYFHRAGKEIERIEREKKE